jgi:hypothetical protein
VTILSIRPPVAKSLALPVAPAAEPLVVRWVARPTHNPDHLGYWTGTLAIGPDTYAVRHFFTWDDDTGHRWSIFDLFKIGTGKHHRLAFGPDGDQCDCEWSTYHPAGKPCRHRRAIPVALGHLDELERAEWECQSAAANLDRLLSEGVPF